MAFLRAPDGKARLTLPTGECGCGRKFVRLNSMQSKCVPCLAKIGPTKRKAEKTLRKESAKPRNKLQKEAQAAFNKYVRLRDIVAGHGCIDCGKPFEPQKPGGSIDAGHYLSRGSAPHLKFDERNVFAQRKNCNRPGGATRDAFRLGVIARIGLEAVEALEADQSVKKYTDDDFRAIRDAYRAKAKAINV